jgi:ADP-glucose pyrophosphorylase
MADFHGIIFAYSAAPEMGELVRTRTSSSLPFCGRYRLIDFALSSMQNAGIRDVGVIMQRDYQSLLDHLGSGKDWDMSRRRGGLRMLPPFGLPEYHTGEYIGTIEALNAVSTYIHDIPHDHHMLLRDVVYVGGNCVQRLDGTDIFAGVIFRQTEGRQHAQPSPAAASASAATLSSGTGRCTWQTSASPPASRSTACPLSTVKY